MIVLSGADLVLTGGIRSTATVIIEGDRIIDVVPGARAAGAPGQHYDLSRYFVVPGFIDVHVHGVDGVDVLDAPDDVGENETNDALTKIAIRLPTYGVTSFCPTTVACSVVALERVLESVQRRSELPAVPGAHVIGAHLESNFINPDYKGAQPREYLYRPSSAEAEPILREIERSRRSVSIVTLAPELDGASNVIGSLVKSGVHVSLGHSGASFEIAEAAIDAGARHATHLFNRMPPLHHRDPGLTGAVMTRDEVTAEIICDGVHVHSSMIQVALAAKGADRIMAITDGTAASGLAEGAVASLGGRPICVRAGAAYLDDGTLAGSAATMDRVFRFLVHKVGLSPVEASQLCSATPAAALGLHDRGAIVSGAVADLVVLDRDLVVKQTYVAGRLAYSAI
jgi:N-acetylglucosamine-6-phosphate deacetylase